jgi:putative transposase
LYAAIDLDTKLILDMALFGRHGTDPAAAFLSGLDEKHDLSDTVILVDQFGYRTAPSRLGLSGQVDYTDRNLIETWFHTLTMRVDRFHNSWVGSRRSVRQFLVVFAHYYNYLRPHQSFDGRTPVEEMLNWTVPSSSFCCSFESRRGRPGRSSSVATRAIVVGSSDSAEKRSIQL